MKHYKLRMMPAWIKQLQEIAESLGRSVSDIIREAIAEWLQKRGYAPAAGASA